MYKSTLFFIVKVKSLKFDYTIIYNMHVYTGEGWKVNRLKSSYDNVIPAVGEFLTNKIQVPQRWWKKCVDRKEDYVWKI